MPVHRAGDGRGGKLCLRDGQDLPGRAGEGAVSVPGAVLSDDGRAVRADGAAAA